MAPRFGRDAVTEPARMPFQDTGNPDTPSLSEHLLTLVGWCLLLLALGTLPFLVFVPDASYDRLRLPVFRPPSAWFASIWASLYVSMAVALWLMRSTFSVEDAQRQRASRLFAVQYGMHLLWAPVIYALQAPLLLAAWLAALMVVLLFAGWAFARIRALSAVCLLPWAVWVAYAIWFFVEMGRMNP